MSATAIITGIPVNPRRPVSSWLNAWARRRRHTPQRWATLTGRPEKTVRDRILTDATWSADDFARLLIADPEFERDFQRKLKEMRACISG